MSAVFDKIEGILTDAYSVSNYVDLMNEILDDLRIVAPNNPRKEFTNFSSHIESSTHVGNYTSPDGKKIIVMAVELKSQTYVENSRSTQRSYAKRLIENANADAALVAFYTPGDPRWRLSFVRLDYEMKIENGKLKTAENMTPARRYSFLVGKDEPCHTAIERFRLFLEKHDANPTLDDLENAFSVEAVTKEFFELYCEKFHQLREALEKNADFLEEAKLHNYTSAQFAKKLMGQIVFLYFLQKKGWLGVSAWPRQLSAVDYKKAFFARGAKSRELIPVVYQQVDDNTYRIRNCIFAVDIEPSAVDIAQLRLWLALVIDDEIDPNAISALDGHRNPLPLPNLECNILCGNSLIDEFEGIKLINESDIIGTAGDVMQVNLYQSAFDATLQRLIDKQQELFKCDNTEKKVQLLQDIDALREDVIMSQLRTVASADQLVRYNETKNMASKPFILWQLDFARVFREKGGFDIVIGNPPYVDSEVMTKLMPNERELYTKKYRSAKGNWDLFVLFIEKGILLINKNGYHTFIVPNKLISAPYSKTIKSIMSECTIYEIRDYSNVTVFKTAAVYPVVFRLGKKKNDIPVIMDVMDEILKVGLHNKIDPNTFYANTDWDQYFGSDNNALDLIQKIQAFPTLSSMATVNGAATVGEAYLVKEFIFDSQESKDDIKKFMNTGTLDPYRSFYGIEDTRYLKGKYLHPVVKREDLGKMSEKRLRESDAEKIIIGGMTKILECYYDDGEYLAGKSTTIVYSNPHLRYITAVLNSRLMTFYYSRFFNSMSLAGGFYRIGAPQIKQLPIAVPGEEKIVEEIEELVTRVQNEWKNSGDKQTIAGIMQTIDMYVYDIYGLTENEIKIIEESK